MKKLSAVLVVLASVLGYALAKKLPPEFKICKRSDPDVAKCLSEAIMDAFPKLKDGIPEFNVAPLEPLHIPSVTIGEGKGPVNVLQKYTDVNIYNIINSDVKVIEASLIDDFKFDVNVSAPEFRLEANYDFNGRVLLLPIVGNGKCVIKLINPKARLTFTGEKVQKKGVTHIEVNDFKVMLDPEKVTFRFDNLFNGDERLGEDMNALLNENWNDIFQDVKSGYEEFLGSIAKHLTNSIYMKVSYDELFPQ